MNNKKLFKTLTISAVSLATAAAAAVTPIVVMNAKNTHLHSGKKDNDDWTIGSNMNWECFCVVDMDSGEAWGTHPDDQGGGAGHTEIVTTAPLETVIVNTTDEEQATSLLLQAAVWIGDEETGGWQYANTSGESTDLDHITITNPLSNNLDISMNSEGGLVFKAKTTDVSGSGNVIFTIQTESMGGKSISVTIPVMLVSSKLALDKESMTLHNDGVTGNVTATVGGLAPGSTITADPAATKTVSNVTVTTKSGTSATIAESATTGTYVITPSTTVSGTTIFTFTCDDDSTETIDFAVNVIGQHEVTPTTSLAKVKLGSTNTVKFKAQSGQGGTVSDWTATLSNDTALITATVTSVENDEITVTLDATGSSAVLGSGTLYLWYKGEAAAAGNVQYVCYQSDIALSRSAGSQFTITNAATDNVITVTVDSAAASAGTLSYSSSNTAVATVAQAESGGNAQLTLNNTGTAKITVWLTADPNSYAEYDITVVEPTWKIGIGDSTSQETGGTFSDMVYNGSKMFYIYANDVKLSNDSDNITFSITNNQTGVLSLDNTTKGQVNYNHKGTATVNVTWTSATGGFVKTVSVAVTLAAHVYHFCESATSLTAITEYTVDSWLHNPQQVFIANVADSTLAASLQDKTQFSLEATLKSGTMPITIGEGNEITLTGAAGTATITAHPVYDEYAAEFSVDYTVAEPDLKVVDSAGTGTKYVADNGATLSLQIKEDGEYVDVDTDMFTVTWAVKTGTSATIAAGTTTGTGVLTYLQEGTTTVTATITNKETSASTTVDYDVVVTADTITLSHTSMTLAVGGSGKQIQAKVNNETSWRSSLAGFTCTIDKTSVATISDNGTVTPVAAGTATATITWQPREGAATVVKTVAITVVSSVLGLNYTWLSGSVVDKGPKLIGYFNGAAVAATFSSSNTAVAKVATDGTVTYVGEGTCTITASYTEEEITVTNTCTVIVTACSLGLNYTTVSDSMMSGSKQLKAYYGGVELAGTDCTWTVKDGSATYVSVDTTGKVTYLAAGTGTIICSYTDAGGTKHTKECTFTITTAVFTINVPSKIRGRAGATKQITGCLNGVEMTATEQAKVVFVSNNTSVAKFSESTNGLLEYQTPSAVKHVQTTITATYNGTTITVTVDVYKV